MGRSHSGSESVAKLQGENQPTEDDFQALRGDEKQKKGTWTNAEIAMCAPYAVRNVAQSVEACETLFFRRSL